jgi:hypothetical protein
MQMSKCADVQMENRGGAEGTAPLRGWGSADEKCICEIGVFYSQLTIHN